LYDDVVDIKAGLDYASGVSLADTIRFKLIEFRRRHGLLQRDFAKKTGIPPHVLSHLERGNTEWTLTRIEQVSAAFDLPALYFFIDVGVNSKEENARRVLEMSDVQWDVAHKFLKLITEIDTDTMKRATQFLARFQSEEP